MADWERPEGDGVRTIGERVRSLRRSAGLSQAELAGGRFSKEYVSQIERGKTEPTRETLEWLAGRLGTDRELLETGVSRADAERFEAAVRGAEELVEQHRYDDALRAFRAARSVDGAGSAPALSLRLLKGEAWARAGNGDLDEAMSLLEQAAAMALAAGFGEVDRAEIVFQVGVVRYHQASIPEAVVLLDEALLLAESSEAPSDQLRSDILHWRSRCHRRNRDWVAAEEDVERALELAEAAADERRAADALFQASLVAQRQGRWVLARMYAERARSLFDELEDLATVARLLNNLAGLNHLLGDADEALSLLERAFGIFVDLDLPVDAGYVCSSLAEIHLDRDEPALAESNARKALDLIGGRVDHLQEIGTAELALGRSLAAQGSLDEGEQWIARADETFEQARSAAHRSYAWIAQGDVQLERGNDAVAAGLFRRAALALHEAEA